jgi:tetratricopeptide (TPR) repeat protein
MLNALRTNSPDLMERLAEYETAGDYAALRSLINDAWPKRHSLPEEEKAELLLRAGIVAARTGTAAVAGPVHEAAKDMLTESMRIFEGKGLRLKAAEAAFGLALCCKQDGTFDEARVWLRRSEALTPGDEATFRCKTRLMSAIVEEDDGRLEVALCIHEEIERNFLPELTDDNLAGRCHNERAIVLKRLWQAERKESYADAALIGYAAASWHHEKGKDRRSLAIVENNTANLMLVLGRHLDALEHVETALRIVEGLKDRIQTAIFEDTRAQVLLSLGRHPAAVGAARRSVRLLQIGGERALLVESFVTLGRCYARAGEHEGAFESFMGAIEVAEFIEFSGGLASAALSLLEEMPALSPERRWEVHQKCAPHVEASEDGALVRRHSACLARTCEMMVAAPSPAPSAKDVRPLWEEFSLDEAVDEFERLCIALALEEADGCQSRAAKLLKLSNANLSFKLKGKYADLKELVTRGHYTRKEQSPEPVKSPPFIVAEDDSLSDYGIKVDTPVFYRPSADVANGRLAVVEKGGVHYIGVVKRVPAGLHLLPASADAEWDIWEFEVGKYSMVGEVYGYARTEGGKTVAVRVSG